MREAIEEPPVLLEPAAAYATPPRKAVPVSSASPLPLLFVTVTLDLIGFGMVVPLMPLYAERLAASGQAIAALLAGYSLMQFFFAPLWGRLSDRIGRRPVLLCSIFANAACLLAFALSHSYWQLLLARLGAGVCTANISVAAAYVADVTPPSGRARGMGVIGAAFGLGFVLGPFFAGELSPWGLAVPPLVAALLSLLNGLLALALLPESLPVARRARASAQAPRRAWWRERLATLRAAPRTRPLYLLVFLQIAGFAMMELTLALFCEHRFAMAASSSGRLLALVGLVMVVVQGGLIGPLSRRFGEVVLVRASLLALAMCLLAVPAAAAQGRGLFVAVMAGLAAAQGIATPALSALISRAAPTDRQGAALGLSQSSSALARTLGPGLGGLLLDGLGSASCFVGAGLVVGLGALVAAVGLGAVAAHLRTLAVTDKGASA